MNRDSGLIGYAQANGDGHRFLESWLMKSPGFRTPS